MLRSPQAQIQMLASVTNVEEALMALDAGVDVIDLKNPAAGALGALSYGVIEDVVNSIDGRVTLSATIGDLPMEPALLLSSSKAMFDTGVDIVKIGFFGSDFHQECLNALSKLSQQGSKLIAVMLVDEPLDMQLLEPIAEAGFYGVMLDTARKNGDHLLTHISLQKIIDFVQKARGLGLQTGLAGSLQAAHISDLSKTRPSYLGFRGALCEASQRTSRLDPEKMRAIKSLLN